MSAESTYGALHSSEQKAGRLELRMPADRTALSTVTNPVGQKLDRLQISEDKQHQILLAVQEALANAVVHGCRNDASKEVCCHMEWYSDGRILIVVIDPGDGFLPEEVADPVHPDNLFADHGRGLYLIRELMDEVSFHDKGNEIRMWKY